LPIEAAGIYAFANVQTILMTIQPLIHWDPFL